HALEQGHQAIVVVNKIDRPNARPDHVIDRTFDLFVDLGATEEQAEFPVLYTNALTGACGKEPDQLTDSMVPLFEEILHALPAPQVDPKGPLQLQATLMGYDDYKGKIVIGRLNSGSIGKNDHVLRIDRDQNHHPLKVSQVFTHEGLNRIEVDRADAGDIVALTGLGDVGIGDTITDPDHPKALPPIKVEEPTLTVTFGVNSSPFAGREGEY